MSPFVESLTENVQTALERAGALCASVFVATPWNDAAPGILVQVGEGAPVPELAGLDEAIAFTRRTLASGDTLSAATLPACLTSEAPEGCLIPIPLLTTLWPKLASQPGGAGALRRLADRSGARPVAGWIGLRFPDRTWWNGRDRGHSEVVDLAGALAATYVSLYGILTDPVTGLPGRGELYGTLRAEIERARLRGLPFSLLFVNPSGLDETNARLGRRSGDALLREFVEHLHATLRRADTVMRYGGAVFALPLGDVTAEGARLVGEKLCRTVRDHAFLDGTVGLHCSVGIAALDPADPVGLEPLDLIRRADQALSVARRAPGGAVVLWQPDGRVARAEHLDRLLGIFTGQAERDYRNMGLLWEVLQALSVAQGTAGLAQAVVERMGTLLAPSKVGLFVSGKDALQLVAGLVRGPGGMVRLEADALTGDERALNERAFDARATRTLEADPAPSSSADVPRGHTATAVPLLAGERALGTLFLVGDADTMRLDASDAPLLNGVAAQLALALDREQLSERQRALDAQQQTQLRAELHSLRHALQQARFVFRSQVMSDLLATCRRVAGTDTTVLITGESGTGKEMLAHTLHQLSPRRAKPLVIVDCGAIPASLMDSELFGRERGAYTGAQQRAAGRLAQADGGTVFLDEIGELPLEVQAKLLRFVQEKTLTMVGGTRSQRVDVRIIAATNRDLEQEVREGRFREDLFYRLNVVRLRIPALRERPDDVLFLARHFVESMALQYQKPLRGLHPDAEQIIAGHHWPGNVRELQNTILQAVVLAEGELLTPDDFRLIDEARSRLEAHAAPGTAGAAPVVPAHAGSGLPLAAPAAVLPSAPTSALTSAPTSPLAAAPPSHDPSGFDEAWRALERELAVAVTLAADGSAPVGPPLGRWLSRDLVLEAFEQSGRVLARASVLAGLPDTTFARRLRQAESEAATTRTVESWEGVRVAIGAVLRAADRPAANLVSLADDLLLGLVVGRVPSKVSHAASLMGISLPTMKRRLEGRAAATVHVTT